jgi:transposase-like protein
MSAPLSDVEPETTATAARNLSKNAVPVKSKRSYKTVDPAKRRQLIELVNEGQKTIKEAANRLKINYSTAKHIIKSKKAEIPEKEQPTSPPSSLLNGQKVDLPLKQAASIDIETLERKIKALTESS